MCCLYYVQAQRACFASAFFHFLLTDIYGIHDTEAGRLVPLDEHGGYELTWVLGAVVVEVMSDHDVLSFASWEATNAIKMRS
jgi:hypothetical protein